MVLLLWIVYRGFVSKPIRQARERQVTVLDDQREPMSFGECGTVSKTGCFRKTVKGIFLWCRLRRLLEPIRPQRLRYVCRGDVESVSACYLHDILGSLVHFPAEGGTLGNGFDKFLSAFLSTWFSFRLSHRRTDRS